MTASRVALDEARAPEGMRLYAIGDVHGRLDLLVRLHDRIAEELERDKPADWRIIHVGDYIDRGPESAGVIGFLMRRTADDSRVIALKGNHDEGMLDFLAEPDPMMMFARHGGVETAASYGVAVDFSDVQGAVAGAAALQEAIPDAHRAFIADLPVSAQFGDFFFCHAGIRPGVPLADQSARDLMWIRRDFLDWPGLHPKVIVHGHTPKDAPEILPNRVNVDTRAFSSGVLTALVVDGAQKRFIAAHD